MKTRNIRRRNYSMEFLKKQFVNDNTIRNAIISQEEFLELDKFAKERYQDIYFFNCKFDHLDLENYTMQSSMEFKSCLFSNSDFEMCDLVFTAEDCRFVECSFDKSDISGALRSCTLKDITFDLCNVTSDFDNFCNLSNVDFSTSRINGDLPYPSSIKDCKIPTGVTLPEVGKFVGWKKVRNGYILKLQILGERTACIASRKCRADSVKVLAAYGLNDGKAKLISNKEAKAMNFESLHDFNFKYHVGEVVSEKSYVGGIHLECTRGIHFFLTQQEAIDYN